MESTTLTECCLDWNQNLSVDTGNRLVKQVALAGGLSRNGYLYTEEALRDAVPLYVGKPVFLDHASDRLRPQDRSTRDLVGSISNPVFANGRIRGDIRVLDTPSGQTFLKLLEINSPGVGMSHVVKARRSIDGTCVEEIVEVISVDAVINPATTSTFSESTLPGTTTYQETLNSEQSLQQLQEQITLLEERQQQLLLENSRLKTLAESLHRKTQVRELISQLRLPDQAVTDFFVTQLEATADETTRRQMIQDRLAIVSTTGERRPVVQSQERAVLSEGAHSDALFIHSLCRK